MPSPSDYVRYDASLENPEPDEAETSAALQETLRDILEITSQDYGHAVRSVHAKGHGLVDGMFEVLADLPPQLAQGLFARPGRYEAIARFSTNPGDILDDSVSVPRGLALKIVGVDDANDATQDFVMVDGPAFPAPTAAKFLGNLQLLAKTTDRAEWLKKALSAVLRTTETALESVGLESGMVKSLGGAPATHPLGVIYYSATPFRFGNHVAKFSLAPVSPNLLALADAKVNITARPDALREVIAETMIERDSVWEFRVQLCSDVAAMPIEDSSVVWDERKSPFVAVARLTVPAQQSWQHGTSDRREDSLSFTPWHCLDAHRPLGSINRVRQPAYRMSADFRAGFNACPIHQPRAAERVDG